MVRCGCRWQGPCRLAALPVVNWPADRGARSFGPPWRSATTRQNVTLGNGRAIQGRRDEAIVDELSAMAARSGAEFGPGLRRRDQTEASGPDFQRKNPSQRAPLRRSAPDAVLRVGASDSSPRCPRSLSLPRAARWMLTRYASGGWSWTPRAETFDLTGVVQLTSSGRQGPARPGHRTADTASSSSRLFGPGLRQGPELVLPTRCCRPRPSLSALSPCSTGRLPSRNYEPSSTRWLSWHLSLTSVGLPRVRGTRRVPCALVCLVAAGIAVRTVDAPSVESQASTAELNHLRSVNGVLSDMSFDARRSEFIWSGSAPPPLCLVKAVTGIHRSASLDGVYVCITFPGDIADHTEADFARRLLLAAVAGPMMVRAQMSLGPRWRVRFQSKACAGELNEMSSRLGRNG
jgi:hypothetical protein